MTAPDITARFTSPNGAAELIQFADGDWVLRGRIASDFGVFRVDSLLPDVRPDSKASLLALGAAGAERARSGGAA